MVKAFRVWLLGVWSLVPALSFADTYKDLFSPDPVVQRTAVLKIHSLSAYQRKALVFKIFENNGSSDHTRLISLLLPMDYPGKDNLVLALLAWGTPYALGNAVSQQVPILPPAYHRGLKESFLKQLSEDDPARSARAAHGLSLLHRGVRTPQNLFDLYESLSAKGKLPEANVQAIITDMRHWDLIPAVRRMEDAANAICQDESREFTTRIAAAELLISRRGDHRYATPLVRKALLRNEYPGGPEKIAQLFHRTVSLTVQDVELLTLLADHTSLSTESRAMLSWRLIMLGKSFQPVFISEARITWALRAFDIAELDSTSAQQLTRDLVWVMQHHPEYTMRLTMMEAALKTDQGRAHLARFRNRLTQGPHVGVRPPCAEDLAEATLPPLFTRNQLTAD